MQPDTFLPPPLIAALFSFAVVGSITPGPNNIMLTASGVNFGLRRTVPHMAGITTGVALLVLLTGVGLGLLFTALPSVRLVVQVAGIVYTLWLAWKIATAGSLGGGQQHVPHPMTFLGALAFQWVNPKLWVMVIAIAALYVRPGHVAADVPLTILVLVAVNIPCMLVWAGFGVALRDMLQAPGRIRIFNIVMGAALALSVIPLLRV